MVFLIRQLLLFCRRTFGYVFYVLLTWTPALSPLGIGGITSASGPSPSGSSLRLPSQSPLPVSASSLSLSLGTGSLHPLFVAWSAGSLSRWLLRDFVDSSKIDGFLSSVPRQPFDGSRSELQSFCSCWPLGCPSPSYLPFSTSPPMGPSTSPFLSCSYAVAFASNYAKVPGLAEAEGCSSGWRWQAHEHRGSSVGVGFEARFKWATTHDFKYRVSFNFAPSSFCPPPLVSQTTGLACKFGGLQVRIGGDVCCYAASVADSWALGRY